MIVSVADPRMKIQAFRGSTWVTEVRFANTVIWIGAFAFCNATNLTNIVFLDNSSLEVIKCYAFHYCTHLDNVILPETLTEICEGAFMGCRNLRNVTLPKNLECLGPDCFMGTDIREISIPATVQTMAYAFDHNLNTMHCQSQLLGSATKAKGTHRQPSDFQPYMVVMCPGTMRSIGGDQWDFTLPVPLDPKAPFDPDDIAKTVIYPIEGEVELVTADGPLRDQREAVLGGMVDFQKLVVVFVHRSVE